MGTSVKKHRRQDIAVGNEQPMGRAVFRQATFTRSGILPPPGELERYEVLYPGTTEILLNAFSKQVEHRIEIESMVLGGDNRRATIGQVMAFITSTIVIILGFILILLGKDGKGFSLIVGSLTAIAGIFVAGSISRAIERNNKRSK